MISQALPLSPNEAALDQQIGALRQYARPMAGRVVRSPEDARTLYESASTEEEKKTRDTATEFVSILYGMLFKEMDKTVERTGLLDGGKTEEMFRSFVLDDYAKAASGQQNNILTHRVYESLYEANSKIVKPEQATVTPPRLPGR